MQVPIAPKYITSLHTCSYTHLSTFLKFSFTDACRLWWVGEQSSLYEKKGEGGTLLHVTIFKTYWPWILIVEHQCASSIRFSKLLSFKPIDHGFNLHTNS
jgi:hypothetical protein